MANKRLKDIQSGDQDDSIKVEKKQSVKMTSHKSEPADIDPGRASEVVVDKGGKGGGKVIDLRGPNKDHIVGVQPDIQGPEHRFDLWKALQTCSSIVSQAFGKLPLWGSWMLGILIVIFATLLFLTLFQFRLTNATYANYFRLFELDQAENVDREIRDIAGDFSRLRRNFQIVNLAGNNPFVSNKRIAAANNVIHGGTELAHALHLSYDLALDVLDIFEKGEPITDFLLQKKGTFEQISTHLSQAQSAYEQLDPKILGDEQFASFFESKKSELAQANQVFRRIVEKYNIFLNLLGHREPTSILVLNQNQDELRAGGGFPGSAAKLTLYKGHPESWEMRDIYALDWSLLSKEVPPEGINQFRASPGSLDPVDFGVRDANYYPTFAESAAKINALLQQAGFGSVDVVIGINQSLILDLLDITGPIRLDEIQKEITSDNFNVIISSLVESKTFAVNSPKDILFVFGEKFFEGLSQAGTGGIADVVYRQLREGEILAASTDEQDQKWISSLGIFETWRSDHGDWIYPIFTSVSKNKSDRHMIREFVVSHDQADQCLRTFRLNQHHAYNLETDLEIERLYYDLRIQKDLEALKHVQGKGDNRQYIRLLLPRGTEVVDAYGYDLEVEKGKTFTSVSWYQTTRTGHQSEVSFAYRVHDNRCDGKTWMYKQPGLQNSTYRLYLADESMESHEF